VYSWRKGIAQWKVGKTLYLSVPFTWLVPEAEKIAEKHKGKVMIGGPGLMKPTHCEGFEPILFHNPCATFTSRGCVNNCGFCAVPKLEGDLKEIDDFRPAPVICDNNFTACSRKHQELVIDKVKHFDLVDFNQGLEAERFTPELADLLGKLNVHIRFAFDDWESETSVHDAIELCKQRTTKNISVYCLIGFNDDPESSIARLELIRSWGVMPNPMRYQPIKGEYSLVKHSYVHPNWTDKKLKDVMRFYSTLRYFGGMEFEDYKKTDQLQLI
jgi:hypothetical protein